MNYRQKFKEKWIFEEEEEKPWKILKVQRERRKIDATQFLFDAIDGYDFVSCAHTKPKQNLQNEL